MNKLSIFILTVFSAFASLAQTTKDTILEFEVKGESFRMILVEGGTFMMGCTSTESFDCERDEKPAFSATLTDYYIGEFEVTQELWEAVMGKNPSEFKMKNHPVENVTWTDCNKFVKKLSRLTGKHFDLPTESQWEFAARGGIKSEGFRYCGSNNIGEVSWFEGNSNKQAHVVGTLKPNELGIYDMGGNVQEWCRDFYDSYTDTPKTNPKGPEKGFHRVYRGGAWYFNAWYCRPAYRRLNSPKYKFSYLGLRVVMED